MTLFRIVQYRDPMSDEDDEDDEAGEAGEAGDHDEAPARLQTAAYAFFVVAVLFSHVAVPVVKGDPLSELLPSVTFGVLLVATFGTWWFQRIVPGRLAARFDAAAWIDWCVAVAATGAGVGYLHLGWSEWTAWVLVGTGASLGLVQLYGSLDAHWLHAVGALAAGLLALATVYAVVARGADVRWLVLVGPASLAIAADQIVLRRRATG